MFNTFIELIVLTYPIIQTTYYISLRVSNVQENNNREKPKFNPRDVHFLATWWSMYGLFTISEKMLLLENIPLYTLGKSGTLVTLYFDGYQDVVLQKTSDSINKLKNAIGNTQLFIDAKTKVLKLFGYQIVSNS